MEAALIEFFIRAFAGIFVIIDPIGGSSHFVALTESHSQDQKRLIARKACLTALGILVFFMLAGSALFKYFGITLAALKIAGGILLFTVALNMMYAKRSGTKTSPEEEKEAAELDDIAIIPLALPLLSGPGAITTVMVLASEAHSVERVIVLLLSIVLTLVIAFFILSHSVFLKDVLKETGIKILTRIMGLIMSVISVQFVINGLADVLPFILNKL